MKRIQLQQLINPLLFITIASALRLLPHPANIAPITAMALFGGVYLNKKYALVFPLLAMVASDMFLGFSQSTPYVYSSFLLSGLIGVWIGRHKSIATIIAGTLLSSILFFLITNFGFWLSYSLYPKTWSGQMEAYIMALPFFRNTIIGDLFYVGLMFGSYECIRTFIYGRKNIYQNR